MSVPPGSDTAAAAERLVPGGTIEHIDDRLWLVSATTDARTYSVRQLDPRLPASRIELMHEFLSRPELTNATRLVASEGAGAKNFDARDWAEGVVAGASIPAPNWRTVHLPANNDPVLVANAAASLAAFHSSGTTTSLAARTPSYRVKDSITTVRKSLELDERVLASEIRKESRARRWLTASRPLLTNAELNLEQAGFLRDEPLVISHLDLWGSHMVVADEGTTAFLDCSTIATAPAVVDVAQLIARNGAWSSDRVEEALARYADSNLLTPLQRRLVPWFVALDAVSNCGRLLVQGTAERSMHSDAERRALLAGADILLDVLETLAGAFVPPPPRRYRTAGKRQSRSTS